MIGGGQVLFDRTIMDLFYVHQHSGVSSFLKRERERHCTYKVTPRHVRATIVVVGKQSLLHKLGVCL